jgi:hypothetical protein
LQVFYLTVQLLKITRGWETESLAKKAKVCFIPFFFELLPLQLFQDHRDGNLEASRVTVASGLHQAIPRGFQVTVPVGNI